MREHCMNETKKIYEECFKQILEETDKDKRELFIECIFQDKDIRREIIKFKKDWKDSHPYIYLHDEAIEKAILDVARLIKKPKGKVRSPKGYFINHVFKKKKFGSNENFVCKSYLEIYIEKYKEKYGIFNTVSIEQIEMREMNDLSNTWDDKQMQWQVEAIAERHQKYYKDNRTDFSIPDVETMTTETDCILDEIGRQGQEVEIELMAEEEAEKIEHEIKENPDTIRYFDCSLDEYRQKYFYSEDKAWEEYAKRMNKLFGKNGEYWKYVDNVGMIPANRKDGYKEVETFEYTLKKGKKSYLKVYNKKEKLKFDFSKPFTFLLYRFLTKTELEFVDLYYFQCLSLDAISEKMKIEKSTVQNLKSVTKIKIKNILQSFDVICTPDKTLAYWFRKISTREKM